MSKAHQPASSSIEFEATNEVAGAFSGVSSDYTQTFLNAVAAELGIDKSEREPEFVDLKESEAGKQFLLEFQKGIQVAIGRDATSKDSGLFAFVVDSDASPVTTVTAALNTLKPDPVQAAEASKGITVYRQGEWWFVETDEEPAFSVSGELGQKPYGPSPMENHVAREYGFGLPRTKLLQKLSLHATDGRSKNKLNRVPRCFRDLQRQHDRQWSSKLSGFAWEEVPDVCGGLYVRGSVRHRDTEHYMVSLGESWHRAYTHDTTVYQPVPTTYGSGSILLADGTSID